MSATRESFTQPYRLTKKEETIEKEEEERPFFYVFGGYIEELRKEGLEIPKEMQDYELTNFMNSYNKDLGIEREITVMLRLKEPDWKGDKKRKEYIIWYETWYGYDSDGKPINSLTDLPKGMDKEIQFQGGRRYDNKGNKLKPLTAAPRFYYTTPFSSEKVDEILEGVTRTDKESVQYVVRGTRPWGGFSYDEFTQLSFEECDERGKTAKAGTPVTVKTSDKRKG